MACYHALMPTQTTYSFSGGSYRDRQRIALVHVHTGATIRHAVGEHIYKHRCIWLWYLVRRNYGWISAKIFQLETHTFTSIRDVPHRQQRH